MTFDRTEQVEDAEASYRPGYQVAAERILAYISEERLAPGARLPTEKDLSSALGISRSVVREAVKILSAVGRLSVEKGRGIYVAEAGSPMWIESLPESQPTRPDQVLALFEVRLDLETLGARFACARATPAQVQAISAAAEESLTAAKTNNLPRFRIADEQFHRRLAAASNNEYLISILGWVQQLHSRMNLIVLDNSAPGPLLAAAKQHGAVAAAVSAGDAGRAGELVAEHIQNTQRQVQQFIRDRIFSEPLADETPPRA